MMVPPTVAASYDCRRSTRRSARSNPRVTTAHGISQLWEDREYFAWIESYENLACVPRLPVCRRPDGRQARAFRFGSNLSRCCRMFAGPPTCTCGRRLGNAFPDELRDTAASSHATDQSLSSDLGVSRMIRSYVRYGSQCRTPKAAQGVLGRQVSLQRARRAGASARDKAARPQQETPTTPAARFTSLMRMSLPPI
eukprot:scaffold133690_cov32-Tisochrysis_lutea.AAC.4